MSTAIRLRFGGRINHRKLAKARPTVNENFSGNRQTTRLNSFKSLYSIDVDLLGELFDFGTFDVARPIDKPAEFVYAFVAVLKQNFG